MDTINIKNAIYTVWDYLKLDMLLPPRADVLIVLGNRDERTADAAWNVLQKLEIKHLVITGGATPIKNDLGAPTWQEGSEAEHFATILHRKGFNQEILLEREALNTGDNAVLSARLLADRGIYPSSIVIVTKPYMERRALKTFEKQWTLGQPRMYVASIGGSFDQYLNEEQTFDTVANIMVKDFQSIVDYPAKGFMTESQLPEEVLAVQKLLIEAGFTKAL